MTITLADLKIRLLARCDPDRLVDLLSITTEQLVEDFSDEIEEKYDSLVAEFYEDDEDENSD